MEAFNTRIVPNWQPTLFKIILKEHMKEKPAFRSRSGLFAVLGRYFATDKKSVDPAQNRLNPRFSSWDKQC